MKVQDIINAESHNCEKPKKSELLKVTEERYKELFDQVSDIATEIHDDTLDKAIENNGEIHYMSKTLLVACKDIEIESNNEALAIGLITSQIEYKMIESFKAASQQKNILEMLKIIRDVKNN